MSQKMNDKAILGFKERPTSAVHGFSERKAWRGSLSELVVGGFKHGTGFSVISDPAESGRLGFTEFDLWGPQNLSLNPSGLNDPRN